MTQQHSGDQKFTDPKSAIEHVLLFGHGTRINLCNAIFEIIVRADDAEQSAILRFAAERFDSAESNHELVIPPVITDDEKADLERKYGDTIDALLKLLIAQNEPEAEFYQGLWKLVTNPIFSDAKSRTFALYYAFIDRRIPYFQVKPGLKMANEDFKAKLRHLDNRCARLRFLLARDFEQRTERADLLLKEIRGVSDESDQAVLMAYVIGVFQADQDRLVSRLEMLRR